MNVKVTALHRLSSTGPLRGYVDVEFDGWEIRDMRIVQQEGKAAWIAPPQKSWKTPTGETKYTPLVVIPPDAKKQIESAVLAEWEKAK
jgi:DNA-binding cell septation regulator SpoVG